MNDEEAQRFAEIREKLPQAIAEEKARLKLGKQTSGWMKVDEHTSRRATMYKDTLTIETKRHKGGGRIGHEKKEQNEPHTQRKKIEKKSPNYPHGWLKNGNPPGDPRLSPRCGAYAKTTGEGCLQPAMANGRCRLHGGLSTGPRTLEGLERSRRANWKHGRESKEAKETRRAFTVARNIMYHPEKVAGMTVEEMDENFARLKRASDRLMKTPPTQ